MANLLVRVDFPMLSKPLSIDWSPVCNQQEVHMKESPGQKLYVLTVFSYKKPLQLSSEAYVDQYDCGHVWKCDIDYMYQ